MPITPFLPAIGMRPPKGPTHDPGDLCRRPAALAWRTGLAPVVAPREERWPRLPPGDLVRDPGRHATLDAVFRQLFARSAAPPTPDGRRGLLHCLPDAQGSPWAATSRPKEHFARGSSLGVMRKIFGGSFLMRSRGARGPLFRGRSSAVLGRNCWAPMAIRSGVGHRPGPFGGGGKCAGRRPARAVPAPHLPPTVLEPIGLLLAEMEASVQGGVQ